MSAIGPRAAALLALGVMAAACAPPRPAPVRPVEPEALAFDLPYPSPGVPRERRLLFLEKARDEMRRLSVDGLPDEQRTAAAAIAPAARAAAGRATGDEAVKDTEAVLDDCHGQWQRVGCERAKLALQRVALAYGVTLPAELRARLRAKVGAAGAVPSEDAIAHPWTFRETENQRIVSIAGNLVATAVAGDPDGDLARGWGDLALAFLAAHDRDGWYEAESPGYIATSMTALLHLSDFAPQPAVRRLAARELSLLFADWAQRQVGGFPAGPKSRTYLQWALGASTTPWLGWAWLLGVREETADVQFLDWPELAASGYEVPAAVVRLLRERRRVPPYEIAVRRRIELKGRLSLDTALASYATPDYVLGAAQSVDALRLAVSGGQEIVATLYVEGPRFAPLYLWSRTRNATSDRWRTRVRQDLAVGHRNAVLARLGADGSATGHAYLAAAWSAPRVLPKERPGDCDVAVTRSGDTYAALLTVGGWEVAPAHQRFPAYYGRDFVDSWVVVPQRQPADVALWVGRREKDGEIERWVERVRRARFYAGPGGLTLLLPPDAKEGFRRFFYLPGERASVDGRPLD
ncbi:MAG TPA: hypothetical protein VGE98_13695, partial [Thermoanaerobaculia bacterium]